MRVAVMGGGLLGLLSAYFLHKNGKQVTVIERNSGVSEECSFSNGGQLSFYHAEPWARWGNLFRALSWTGKESPIKFSLNPKNGLYGWLLGYLNQCRNKNFVNNIKAILDLNLYSKRVMEQEMENFSWEWDYHKKEILHLFASESGFDDFRAISELQNSLANAPFELLDSKQLSAQEPYIQQRSYGLSYPESSVGDAYKFSLGLSKYLQQNGVEFIYNCNIDEIAIKGDSVSHLKTSQGDIVADKYLCSLGVYSKILMQNVGVKLPLYPIKGYSITCECEGDKLPQSSLFDNGSKVVVTPFNNRLRIAGIGDFKGFDSSVDTKRLSFLQRKAVEILPHLESEIKNGDFWSCLRPSTPNGQAILGRSKKFHNMYFATGNGSLGWTQSFGSAKITVDKMVTDDCNR